MFSLGQVYFSTHVEEGALSWSFFRANRLNEVIRGIGFTGFSIFLSAFFINMARW